MGWRSGTGIYVLDLIIKITYPNANADASQKLFTYRFIETIHPERVSFRVDFFSKPLFLKVSQAPI
jgi:hypothetical protein